MANEWWESFFDESYVDTWAADGAFDETAAQAAELLAFIDLPDGARVLDLPCGFGRFTKPLHDAGFDVTGLDASEDQIRLANERNPGPTYLVGDMRAPPDGPFDAVLNLYSSFGYFEDPDDDIACLRAWHDLLAPDGLLVIETMHRDRLAWLWDKEFDGGVRRETGTTNWATGVRHSTVEVDGEPRDFQVRMYSATDYVRMLTDTGFVDIDVFGGLDGAPLDPSTRLAVKARRA